MGFFGGSRPQRPAPAKRPAPVAEPASPAFDAEAEKAMAELQLKTAAHVAAWHMDEAEWAVDQETGLIRFTDRKRGIVIAAPVQIIGSFNSDQGTWLWGWANRSLLPAMTADAQAVKTHGEGKGHAALTTAKLRCDEPMAWKLAALACMVCGRQGVYRGPAGATKVFMTFGEVRIQAAEKA